MKILSTLLLTLLTSFFLILLSCTEPARCELPSGEWSNGEGQMLVFRENGELLWLTQFGSQYDTVVATASLDCSESPAHLNITDIETGALAGQNLLGIMEWTSDSAFRFQYETGTDEALRPQNFSDGISQRFVKE